MTMKTNLSILLLSSTILLASEQRNSNNHNTHEKSHGSHWSYEGETGPKSWGALKKEYKDCADGARQSPIDIVTDSIKDAESLDNLYFDYKDTDINIVNNGHTIQVNSDNTSYALFQGKKFKLLQFHFHSLSEHSINGKYYPMEVHLVHQAEDGELAVVGVFLKEGEYNKELQKIFKFMPVNVGDSSTNHNFKINSNDLLPKVREYYHYLGSLTTPPCTQIVEWYVMKNPIEISQKQLEQFNKLYSGNYRPTTLLNSRVILKKQEGN